MEKSMIEAKKAQSKWKERKKYQESVTWFNCFFSYTIIYFF